MAPGADPYAALGLARGASADEIAQARRRLSRLYHPDVNPAPDAAARFDEVQRAYQQLSAATGESDQDEQGRTRLVRQPGGGYATEVRSDLFFQPTTVDFGLLTPARPQANAKVTLAWTGPPPTRLESTPGSEWWANLGAEQPATSSVVFYLRAHAHAGTREGRQEGQFRVIFDDTTLTAELTAQVQGEFPPDSQPDFTPRPAPGGEGRLSALPPEMLAWLAVISVLVVILLLVIITSR